MAAPSPVLASPVLARAQTKPLKNINYKRYNAVNTTMSFV